MRFFHVDRFSRLTVGKTIGCDFPISSPKDFLGFSNVTHHGDYYLLQRAPIIKHPKDPTNTNGAVEIFFESVRTQHFSDKPSRFQSFFAFRDIAEAMNFSAYPSGGVKIWEVETENYFCADMNLLSFGHRGIAAFANAHEYWSGNGSEQPLWECLLVPPVTVIRQVTM